MRALSRILAAALVVLLARSIAYALTPSPAARVLEQRAGGPTLPVLTLVALALGASLAIAICWLAALGFRERQLLERRVLAVAPPRFSPARTFALGLDLVPIATSLSFVAAAVLAAAEYVARWMRRTFALLRAVPPQLSWPSARPCPAANNPPAARHIGHGRSRAPPAFS